MNRYFKYRDKTFYFSSWIKSNIIYVKDLFTEHGFKTLEEIGGVLRQKQNWLCEYYIVRNVFKRFENMFNFSMCLYVNIRDITSFVFVTKYDTFCRQKCNFYYHMLLRNKFISPCYKTYLGRQGQITISSDSSSLFGIQFLAIPFAFDFAFKMHIKEKSLKHSIN